MELPVALLAVPMPEERRRIARERIGAVAEVLVRGDLSDAELARRAPEVVVLVTGGFPRDIPPEVWPTMVRLKLLQTVAAGGDHLPHDPIPPGGTVCPHAGAHPGSIAEHPMAPPPAAGKNIPPHPHPIPPAEVPHARTGRPDRRQT